MVRLARSFLSPTTLWILAHVLDASCRSPSCTGLIATVCMKEAFGLRDAAGLICIAAGVVLVVTQVPDVQLSLTSYVIWHHVIRQVRRLHWRPVS